MSSPAPPRRSPQLKPGHCYSDLCLRPLPATGYVVCPHCNEAAKRSRMGATNGAADGDVVAYCNETCRSLHWEGAHRLECAMMLEAAVRSEQLQTASQAVLEQLRAENAKIPITLGETYCDGCHERKNNELKVCKKCRSALYCCRECQVSDWNKRHKKLCRKPFTAGWESPLYRCVVKGDVQGLKRTLEYIQENGLSAAEHINYQDEKGGLSSALYLAVENHPTRLPMIPLLLQAGADVNQVFRGYSPLMECTFPIPGRERVELSVLTAQALLSAGADVNQCDFTGLSPLISAVRNDRHELVRYLLQAGAGASVNHQENSGITALFAAAMDGAILSMKVLHEYQARPSICANDGRSPLFVASENGHLDCVKYLVDDMGADPNQYYTTPSGESLSPVLSAFLNGRTAIVQYLKRKGARLARDG